MYHFSIFLISGNQVQHDIEKNSANDILTKNLMFWLIWNLKSVCLRWMCFSFDVDVTDYSCFLYAFFALELEKDILFLRK